MRVVEAPARLRVLISAYACSPCRGSEPGVGWGFVSGLARHHDLWVIVEAEKFRREIEDWQAANSGHPAASIRFHFLRKRRNRTLRRIWPPSYYWYYRRWQRDALALARRLDAGIGFDLVHQLTMVGWREPGFLWMLERPFVWGPVGGMGRFPPAFLPVLDRHHRLYYRAYNAWNTAQPALMRRAFLAARRAGEAGLVLATEENRQAARRFWGISGQVLAEVGSTEIRPPVGPRPRQPGEPLRLFWAGRLVARKALGLALRGLARVPPEIDWRLAIAGDGPERARWQALAQELGLAGRCRFLGEIPRPAVLAAMADAHVMLITSLRDLTATVTVEALSMALPVICPDHCGFADAVTAEAGLLLRVTTPQSFVRDIAAATTRLARDEALRLQLSRGALRRADAFLWERKALAMDAIYRQRIAAGR
jgi:glycosyltransferase involved in cell wall biosynthesis